MSVIALNVGELVAFLRLDDSEFQRTLSRSGNSLQSLGQSAARLLQPAATAFAATTTAGAGVAAMLLRQGIAYNTLQQSSRAALKTITGSAEAANKQMDKLDDFARTSPFAKDVFITAQQQMLGFGIESEKVIPYLSAIQDATAAIGGSNQEVGDLAFIMAQISAAGKITGQDLLQFGGRGVNAAKLIGDAMGKTEGQIRESITKGTLDADQALDALAQGMSKTYEGAAAGVKDTWVGAVDRIKGATRDLGSVLASPFVDPRGGGMALDWANGLADLLRAVEAQAKPFIETLLPKMVPLGEKITATLQRATDAVNAMDPGEVMAFLGSFSEYVTPLAGVAAGLFAMGTNIRPLAALGLTLNPFVAVLAAVVATSEDARQASLDLVAALAPLRDEFSDLLVAGGDLANVVLSALVDILGALADGAGAAGGPVDILALGIDGLTTATRFVTSLVEPLAGFLTSLAGSASGATGPVLGIVAAMLAMQRVNVSGAVTALTTSLSNARQTWQASQGTLQALGQNANFANTAMMTARAGAVALGGALKTAFVANAPMLAVAALAATIGFFVQKAAEAEAQTEDLLATFDRLTGLATEQTFTLITDQLNDSLSRGDWDTLKQIGVDYTDMMNAITKGGQYAIEVREELLQATQTGSQAEKEAARVALKALDETGGAYQDAAGEAKTYAEQQAMATAEADRAASQAGATTSALQEFEDALAVLSDEASSAEQRLNALNDIMDLMAGGIPSVSDATIAHADALRAATKAAEGFEFSQEQLNSILSDDGSLNLQSEAVSNLRGEMDSMVSSAQKQAEALIQAEDTEGAVKAYADLEQQLRDFAAQAGVESPEAVDALIGSLGLLPPEVMVDLQMNGTEASAESIQMVQQHLADLPDTVMTFINGDTTGIETKVDETGLRMAYVASLAADPMIGADDNENVRIVAAASARLIELDGMEPTPEIDAEKQALERVVRGAKVDLNSIPDKEAEVIAKTFGFASVQEMRREIERLRSKTVRVETRFVTTGKPPKTSGTGPRVATFADGAVIDGALKASQQIRHFANGSENHVAQIAPAGAWRVWAEEETGGEGYVPLALSKRARSLQIMHDIAGRFGHVMVPVSAQRYADGGSTVQTSSTAVMEAGPSFADMEAAFTSALSNVQPVIKIGDQVVYGAMQRAERRFG